MSRKLSSASGQSERWKRRHEHEVEVGIAKSESRRWSVNSDLQATLDTLKEQFAKREREDGKS